MKTIGLIGGMSWESSKLYYEFLNTRAKEILGGSHSAKCIMVSVDFGKIERLTFAGDWAAIGECMKEAAQQLERGGADIILLCTNTIHLVSHYISDNVSIPFMHIATTTGDDIIYDELVKGQFTDTSKQKIIKVIEKQQSLGAEGVILGCTELPILISEQDVEIPTFDTGKIHAHKAMEWSLSNN